jgi:hypothetical protein
MAYFHSPRIIADNLVLALDAANTKSYPGSGTAWTDLSGNGNNGTLVNGPVFDGENLGSISFDGVNDSVQITRVPSIDFTPTSSFTMMVWAKVLGLSGDFTANRSSTVFGRGSTTNSFGIGVQRNTNNTFLWTIGSRATDIIQTTISFTPGTIQFLTFVYTPTFQYVYRNGVLNNTQDTSGGVGGSFQNTFYAMAINRAVPGGNSSWMNGNVYNAMMYNRALTSDEVLQNYNATKGRFGL